MPDDTTEAREVAERFRPFFGNWMRGQTPMHEWLASEIADALAAARQSAIEEAARVVAERIDLYRAKNARHDPLGPDAYSAHERVAHTIEALDVLLNAIRQLGFSGEEAK